MNSNNCYYNIDNMCTHPKSYSKHIGASGRDWDSKESCTFTQYGAQTVCSWYKIQN